MFFFIIVLHRFVFFPEISLAVKIHGFQCKTRSPTEALESIFRDGHHHALSRRKPEGPLAALSRGLFVNSAGIPSGSVKIAIENGSLTVEFPVPNGDCFQTCAKIYILPYFVVDCHFRIINQGPCNYNHGHHLKKPYAR